MRPGFRVLVAVACALACGLVSHGQVAPPETTPEIVTDRPDITESSIVVPKTSLQLENGLTWTAVHGSEELDGSETLMRLGVLTRTEFRFVLPNYITGIGGREGSSGFGDAGVGIKQQLGPLGKVDLSVIAAVSVPTGAAGISTHGFDPFLKFPWSRELTRSWRKASPHSLNTEPISHRWEEPGRLPTSAPRTKQPGNNKSTFILGSVCHTRRRVNSWRSVTRSG
jgi:hypothetical protein